MSFEYSSYQRAQARFVDREEKYCHNQAIPIEILEDQWFVALIDYSFRQSRCIAAQLRKVLQRWEAFWIGGNMGNGGLGIQDDNRLLVQAHLKWGWSKGVVTISYACQSSS